MAYKFEIVLFNKGFPLTGYDGYVGIVAANGAVGSIETLTENTNNDGEYYKANVDDGYYDVYIDLDKSGSFVAGDLFKEDVRHGIPDGYVTAGMTDFAYE